MVGNVTLREYKLWAYRSRGLGDWQLKKMRKFVRKHPVTLKTPVRVGLKEPYGLCVGTNHPFRRLYVCHDGGGFKLIWYTYFDRWDYNGRRVGKSRHYPNADALWADFLEEFLFLEQHSNITTGGIECQAR